MSKTIFSPSNKPLFLAPMAEITHYPFRKLLEEIGGVDVFYTEMLSANLLASSNINKSVFLKGIEYKREKPLIFQLLGNDVNVLKKAAKVSLSLGADGIDLNLGCSAPFVYKKGMGSGLLLDRKKLKFILSELRNVIDKSFSVKMRIGLKENLEDFLKLIVDIKECGVDFIVVHPRLIKEKFKRKARWNYIAYAKSIGGVKIVGNGDICDFYEGIKRRDEEFVDGIMIGRCAVSNPWIFKEIKEGEEVKKDFKWTFLRFMELVREYLPEKYQLSRIKIFSKWFTKNIEFGHFLWKEINKSDNLSEIERKILDFFE